MDYYRLSDCDLTKYINQKVPLIFLVKSVEIKPYNNKQGEFMVVILKDRDTEIDAKIWVITDQIKEGLKPGKVYQGLIEVRPYEKAKNGISCIIYNFEAVDIPPEALAEWEPRLQQCNEILSSVLNTLTGSIYFEICKLLLLNNWNNFAFWSAGKGQHHTQLGALLCHTATVAQCSLEIGKFYNKVYGDNFVDLKLLAAGALLHDIGKLHELSVDRISGNTEYTSEAALQTHLLSGVLDIDRAAIKLGLNPESQEIMLLEHLVASHHGLPEWGTLITPNTTEALILHTVDSLDAELWKFDKHLSKLESGQMETLWVGGKARAIYKHS